MEKRYAIIIGINDYSNVPLDYCVNDAKEVKARILNRAKFKEEDIYLLTSEINSPIKDISGKFNQAFATISKTFIEEEDSIFFYFAGHGYANNSSFIMFQDTEIDIKTIFDNFSAIKPKYQFFVFDSCNSGGKALARTMPAHTEERIEFSRGATLLYACTDSQPAKESEELKHGILTDAFLKVLDNDLLYGADDGTLTPSRISEEVLKLVSVYTSWAQTPVCESRVTGSYPFCFIDREGDPIEKSSNTETEDSTQTPILSAETISDTRDLLLKTAISKIDSEISLLKSNFVEKSYTNTISNVIPSKHAFSNPDKILSSLVHLAEPYSPVQNCIGAQTKEVRKKHHAWLNASMLIGGIYGDSSDNYETVEYPGINYIEGLIYNKTCIFESLSIRIPSFCIGLIAAQAKWGMIIISYIFKVDWDGEKDSIICDISNKLYPFPLEYTAVDKIKKSIFFETQTIRELLDKWRLERNKEIDSFST